MSKKTWDYFMLGIITIAAASSATGIGYVLYLIAKDAA